MSHTTFDDFAGRYEEALNEGLSVSGEDKWYFARARVEWLARCLSRLGATPSRVLDYGCGTGSTTPLLKDVLSASTVVGIDVSTKSIEVARSSHVAPGLSFVDDADYAPSGDIDIAYCNGVFHHIPPDERLVSLRFIAASLRAGGMFSLWENNPWNPGSRYVMKRIPFDRDAVMLSSREAHSLLRRAGFEIVQTDYLFYFPRALRALRPLEPALARLPLGAQYQVLARLPK